mmetsp:Transcript_14436/g.19257  ORF Transcript_14436/g.19257 Transcript_14436/m.19257 type:complete len:178 (-) Transcript_14436:1051-1584(-)
MLFSKTIPLWNEMADESVVGLLDILFSTLTFLCLLHAVSKRGICTGIAVVVYLFLHTMLFEHTSLFLGGTHCHATSPLLPMITPCSSINSVLFYIPWLYTSIESARRMDLNPICYPFVVGERYVFCLRPRHRCCHCHRLHPLIVLLVLLICHRISRFWIRDCLRNAGSIEQLLEMAR